MYLDCVWRADVYFMSLLITHINIFWAQSAILALDDTILDADQVENLIKFTPTKEEIELLKVIVMLIFS
jgi:hypothetical protein